MRHPKIKTLFLASLLALIPAALGGCEKEEEAPAATVEADPGAGAADEAAAAAGEEPAPEMEAVIFAFQPQENPDALTPDANKLAEYLAAKIGVPVKVFLPTNYAAVVEALRGGNADVAYFSGWPYLTAHQTTGAELILAEERGGQAFYYSQWYVLKDSPIQSLADLKGKDIAFTSPTSTSGYLFPMAKVIEDTELETGQDPKTFFDEIIFAGGYQQALKALAEGKVEAAAASDYAFGQYLSPEEQAKIRVLSKQGPVPTHGVAVAKRVPPAMRTKIQEALLSLNEPENKELLKSVYGAEKLVARTHEEHVAPLQKALDLVGSEQKVEDSAAR